MYSTLSEIITGSELIDTHYFTMNNKRLLFLTDRNDLPNLPIYSNFKPDIKIKNKKRIDRIVNDYCSKKH